MAHKTFITTNTEHSPIEFERISRWITRTFDLVTPRSELYDYSTDDNGYKPHDSNFTTPADGRTVVDFYRFQGRKYAVERFYLLGNPFFMQGYNEHLLADDGEHVELHAVDMDGDIYNPLYIEISPDGEQVRFYQRVHVNY